MWVEEIDGFCLVIHKETKSALACIAKSFPTSLSKDMHPFYPPLSNFSTNTTTMSKGCFFASTTIIIANTALFIDKIDTRIRETGRKLSKSKRRRTRRKNHRIF